MFDLGNRLFRNEPLMICQILAPLLSSLVLQTPAQATAPFSHADWAAVLEEVVDARGLVDYRSLALDPTVLDRYVATIAQESPKNAPKRFASKDHQLAYYLNAYNALVLRGVLDLGPDVSSVWGESGTGLGFFVMRKVRVGGEKMSLKALEDDVIRKQFADPRVHAALNCASMGCPRLPREPFTGELLQDQLDSAMREFVADSLHVLVRPAENEVVLSKIFDWFSDDFLDGERRRGVDRPHIVGYLNRFRLQGSQIPIGAKVRFKEYDKRLNRRP